MTEFQELPCDTPLGAGLVLRFSEGKTERMERITHVFTGTIYTMQIGTASDARYAKRPKRLRMTLLTTAIAGKKVSIGRMLLPPELATPVEEGLGSVISIREHVLAPLLEEFSVERGLNRDNFTQAIRKRAMDLQWSEVSLRRLLLRWWYFGGVRSTLQPLVSGPKAATARTVDRPSDSDSIDRRKPGQRSALVCEFGENEFIVCAEDVEDMTAALIRLARRAKKDSPDVGRVTIGMAYKEWLKTDFKKRRPDLYMRWTKHQHVPPLSQSQYYRYVKAYATVPDELLDFVPALARRRSGRALLCSGPGEVYELDATGGQIVLIAPGGKRFRPVIYC